MHTRRTLQVLNTIRAYQVKHQGVSPSFDEIAAICELSNKSEASRIVHQLEERGYIRRLPFRARSIEIVERTRLKRPDPGRCIPIPVMGVID